MKSHTPFGGWPSPISATMVAGKSPVLSDTLIDQGRVFWSQIIPEQKGRNAIMMHDGGQLQCVLPQPLSAKSKVHEYGGAPYTVHNNHLYFVLGDDQRIYRGDFTQADFHPEAMTPAGNYRYADLIIDKHAQRIIAVCEDHTFETDVQNYLVAIPLDGSRSFDVLTRGHDFYANPRISPDGKKICWLCWDHPDMPWDNTELWVAELKDKQLTNNRKLVGNGAESIFQPRWSHNNDLFFVSDRSDWWNIYFIPSDSLNSKEISAQPVLPMAAEFATPQWVFGMSTYGFLNTDTIVATCTSNGRWRLFEIDLRRRDNIGVKEIETPCSYLYGISSGTNQASFIGASSTSNNNVYRYSDRKIRALIPIKALVDINEYSLPKAIEFPTSNGNTARALFYAPRNTQYTCETELPPLIVICHGGPTGSSERNLNLKIQYWTNRGFAVADVNYRGSTGYGREFRQNLFKQWGVYDVDDVCAVVDYLGEQRCIDKRRCVIKGSSAGGFTVLAALAFRNTFSAGVSLYGIGDLEALARDTHKFEARYLDKLVGSYPAEKAVYRERSPIHFIDQINCPLLIFQGLQDKVVPPNQAKAMFEALKQKGVPVAHITYPEEAHGFREAATIEHMLDCEMQFYARLFGFSPPQASQHQLIIENLPSREEQ